MGDYCDLLVYQKAYALAMDLFQISKRFPPEEKYALTGQIRRASRSVCSNFAEGYRKRSYRQHFILKLTDCDSENTETEVWIMFSKDCEYISPEEFEDLYTRNIEVRRMLHHIIKNPEKYM
jgi:four helix bundle protein